MEMHGESRIKMCWVCIDGVFDAVGVRYWTNVVRF